MSKSDPSISTGKGSSSSSSSSKSLCISIYLSIYKYTLPLVELVAFRDQTLLQQSAYPLKINFGGNCEAPKSRFIIAQATRAEEVLNSMENFRVLLSYRKHWPSILVSAPLLAVNVSKERTLPIDKAREPINIQRLSYIPLACLIYMCCTYIEGAR